MPRLTKNDLAHATNRLPKKLAALLKQNPNKIIIAGGYLRSRITGEKVQDIDLFAPNKDDAYRFALQYALASAFGAEPDDEDRAFAEAMIHATDNAYTVKGSWPTVQVIHRWTFDDPVAAIESFDFTIAKAAIWYDGAAWDSVCHPEYYADLAAKRLVYTSPIREEEPGGSLLRVLKFYQRGYRIPMESLAAVLARLTVGIDWEKIRNPIEPLGSTPEAALAKVLTGLLREVDPLAPSDENTDTQESESHE